jgi:hypothetical protein
LVVGTDSDARDETDERDKWDGRLLLNMHMYSYPYMFVNNVPDPGCLSLVLILFFPDLGSQSPDPSTAKNEWETNLLSYLFL